MELGTVLGIGLSLAAMLVALIMDGGHLESLWAPSSLILIVGGTLGMTMANFSFRKFLQLPAQIMKSIFPRQQDGSKLVGLIVDMAEKARKDGLLSLEGEMNRVTHPLLQRGLSMVIDGVDPHQLRHILEMQVEMEKHHQEDLANMLEQAGGYSPTVGIIGTVMGLVHVLSNLQEVDKLGPLIAVAFMATFYGIFLANVFWLPLAGKLKGLAAEEAAQGRMIIEGLAALQTGQNPRTLRENLELFIHGSAKARRGNAAAREEA